MLRQVRRIERVAGLAGKPIDVRVEYSLARVGPDSTIDERVDVVDSTLAELTSLSEESGSSSSVLFLAIAAYFEKFHGVVDAYACRTDDSSIGAFLTSDNKLYLYGNDRRLMRRFFVAEAIPSDALVVNDRRSDDGRDARTCSVIATILSLERSMIASDVPLERSLNELIAAAENGNSRSSICDRVALTTKR